VRVMVVVDVLSGGAAGGAERIAALLGRELMTRGVEVATILPMNEHTEGALAALGAQGFHVQSHPSMLPVDVPRRAADVWRLARFIRAFRPDVLSMHTGCPWIRSKDVLAARLAGAPCVVTVHGGEQLDSAVYQRRTRRAARFLRRIVVHGSMVKRSLVSAGVPAGGIDVVPCGVPAPHERPSRERARALLGVPSDAFVVSTLGRLIPRKGIGDLIAAFGLLPADGGRSLLFVGGDGPERERLERMVDGSVAGRVRFLGTLADPAALYAASDLFVLPARHEAFGLVYVEAAHFGVTSIGGSEDGTADAIEHEVSGLLVKPGDVHSLVLAIERLRDDTELRNRLSAAAARQAARRFSVAAMTDGYWRALGLPLARASA